MNSCQSIGVPGGALGSAYPSAEMTTGTTARGGGYPWPSDTSSSNTSRGAIRCSADSYSTVNVKGAAPSMPPPEEWPLASTAPVRSLSRGPGRKPRPAPRWWANDCHPRGAVGRICALDPTMGESLKRLGPSNPAGCDVCTARQVSGGRTAGPSGWPGDSFVLRED